jgi:predicted nucleotidyltransferase
MLFSPLDSILSSGVRVRVLRALVDARHAMSGREVARLARAGRSMTQHVLGEFAELAIVLAETTPAQHLYRLNEQHQLVRDGILPLFRAERQRAIALFAELKRILAEDAGAPEGRVLGAYVFGSAARGDDAPGSDLDLLVLTGSAREAEAVHDLLSGHAPALRTCFGVALSPVVMDAARARRQAAGEDSFLRNVVRDGRRVHGQPLEDLLHG